MSRRSAAPGDDRRWVFNRLAEEYRHRPPYPAALVERLLALAGGPGARIAELGAGTGLLAVPLARAGVHVMAVEPARRMLDVLRAEGVPGLEPVHASAEETGLPGGAFQLVVLADALQWVDPDRGGREAARLMADEGGVIINITDSGAGKAWTGYPAYSISKGALETLTRLQARALAPRIRVNAVAPGLVLPAEGFPAQEWQRLNQRVPLKQPVAVESIARGGECGGVVSAAAAGIYVVHPEVDLAVEAAAAQGHRVLQLVLSALPVEGVQPLLPAFAQAAAAANFVLHERHQALPVPVCALQPKNQPRQPSTALPQTGSLPGRAEFLSAQPGVSPCGWHTLGAHSILCQLLCHRFLACAAPLPSG